MSGAVDGDANKLSEASLNFLLVGILGIPIAGIGVIIGLMSVMKNELGFSTELIITFVRLSFLMLLAAESVFIWLLISRTRAAKKSGENARPEESVAQGLGQAPARELSEPAHSVTENTTRNLEPVYHESKTR